MSTSRQGRTETDVVGLCNSMGLGIHSARNFKVPTRLEEIKNKFYSLALIKKVLDVVTNAPKTHAWLRLCLLDSCKFKECYTLVLSLRKI